MSVSDEVFALYFLYVKRSCLVLICSYFEEAVWPSG